MSKEFKINALASVADEVVALVGGLSPSGTVIPFPTDASGLVRVSGISEGAFAPSRYDEIVLGYTGDNLTTVVYKLLTATVGTLTLTYTGARLDKVVRS
jgi:hypothetical protein